MPGTFVGIASNMSLSQLNGKLVPTLDVAFMRVDPEYSIIEGEKYSIKKQNKLTTARMDFDVDSLGYLIESLKKLEIDLQEMGLAYAD